MIDTEKRAELLRPKMMKDGKYLVARIEGSGQERDAKKVLQDYFRYKDYISGDTEFEKEWLKTPLKLVWSPKFTGLVPDFRSKPLKEVKKLEFQNPAYVAAFRHYRRRGDPRNYNKVFAVQFSGCTLACNYCYVPPEINAANSEFGKYFSAKEIVDNFLVAREQSKEPMNVVRNTGGEPTIIPEAIIDVHRELERRGLDDVYVWNDTNLSTARYLEKLEDDLKNIMRKKNVGVVGCFKGMCKEDFSMITGAKPELYEKQFETAKLFLDWGTDFYVYLPALVYGNNSERKTKDFIDRIRELNINLPLRVEMLIIKEYPGAIRNMELKAREGRSMPTIDQRDIFDLWYNKLLPKYYSKEMLEKFCCEVPLG